MDILIFAPHWGSNELAPQVFIERVLAAGFDGIEMSLPLDPVQRDDWTSRIADAGLGLIAQQWETVFHPQFDEHRAALATLLDNACAARPLLVNSHTGKDFYTPAQNRDLIALADHISARHGVPIVHEIHRSRFSGHPMLLLPYLEQDPGLQLTADLSHWCCACESLLEDQPETLARTLPHVRHIHARVGHQQGPQVADFRAPEAQAALQQHLAWWDQIVALRKAAGARQMTMTPEFGPLPYTQALPYTQQPVSNAWELNVAMLDLLRLRYGRSR
ncbi:sugar phosphate isomerase/epimerase family protein [Janthinobacterium agaricidamnosum]|uniref:Xylose isomerase-like TIM barrel family protein n=1 Tax=Janthinobacterium agaricidamnosum NBRC 102515 = DSM 9628 TaxID=1349767 RepID=W0V241_9BURK|nr:xylose isomerase [Janthinobacterium agaricidamnosum]CDG81690.1 xylose isomerase-like TIM barrel family protein [Janthinobacterium agaricidamnosum NBRC 102515 = DSM 9628]